VIAPADVVLETERLWLRRYRDEDLGDLFAVIGDGETMRYYPRPYTRPETAGWIRRQQERYERDGFGLYAVVWKETGAFVGDCGPVVQRVDGADEVELGWHVNREWWGRGVATEAGRGCRDRVFEDLGLGHVISLIRPENLASRRVAEKLGMAVRRRVTWAGMPHDIWWLDRPADGA
jgi:[ribosomal protein S5]-alanine N-acetyltransferase